ncbi:hypothetical protein D9758_014567 [Tetrapyrgos nigripes]|uniref:feruloyl esterase n=1 Tax=Tetrapyrgos nigripes TaxID=182062 RepID=A0A8H5CH54_9AGAR|nr:hypothetical protein D9758_014567 [Tetrapyrgos nigripes]
MNGRVDEKRDESDDRGLDDWHLTPWAALHISRDLCASANLNFGFFSAIFAPRNYSIWDRYLRGSSSTEQKFVIYVCLQICIAAQGVTEDDKEGRGPKTHHPSKLSTTSSSQQRPTACFSRFFAPYFLESDLNPMDISDFSQWYLKVLQQHSTLHLANDVTHPDSPAFPHDAWQLATTRPSIKPHYLQRHAFSTPVSPSIDFDSACSSIAAQISSSVPEYNVTTWFADLVSAGTNLTFPDNDPTCTRPSQVIFADMCRVSVSLPTSERSEISLEAWLPRNWTGGVLSTGNGGLAGCIKYEDLTYGSALGFATVGANNGHNGTSGLPFYHNTEVLEDFTYLSTPASSSAKVSPPPSTAPHIPNLTGWAAQQADVKAVKQAWYGLYTTKRSGNYAYLPGDKS